MTGVRIDRIDDARPRLRILLSAYACEPRKGSEPGIGWRWATAIACAGHEVWVLTRANNRDAIEHALADTPNSRLIFVYYDLPAWARWWKRGGRGVRLYYTLWQWGAYRLARRLCREVRFDIVHHITFGVFRHPSFMGFLGVPFIFGPVGGGETAPRQLRRTFPVRGYVSDLARDVANWVACVDPVMAAVYRRSAAILCKTGETLHAIPEKYRDKCLVQVEVGADDIGPVAMRHRRPADSSFRVLYVGRLLYWKGVHLGLMAFASFRKAQTRARLTVIGSGPDEHWLRKIANRLGIDDAVTWMPWLDRSAVMRAYARHDAFLFPSLHDSSGNVVLEALSCGLPVVCLDVGGPAALVDSSCGFRVPAGEPQQVIDGLAQALATLAQEPALARKMEAAAVDRARRYFSWTRQAARMETLYFSLRAGRQPGRLQVDSPMERSVG